MNCQADDEDEDFVAPPYQLRMSHKTQCLAIFEVASSFLKNMLRIQHDGSFKLANQRNKASPEGIASFLSKFPVSDNGSIAIGTARSRALKYRPKDGNWTQEQMLQARDCFVIGDVVFDSYLFELHFAHILKTEKRFRKR